MGGTKITRTSWSENIKFNIGEQEKRGTNGERRREIRWERYLHYVLETKLLKANHSHFLIKNLW